ncbi:MAG: ABC transporter substrate-binding protein [Candidatus Peribacteria bacterium]|nr:MAG: ABC transporter substrate-binding protein [Candidatus Peribacteria bacterium]
MKKLVLFLGICCSLILLASCGTQSTEQTNSTTSTPENGGVNTEETTTDSPEVIKIGVLAPISGGAAAYGEDAVNAYTQVVEAYNALNTPKIELVVEDSKCNGKDSVLAYNKLVNVDKVQAIAGATCSSATIPAAKITQTSKIPMISPTSSAPSISDIGPYIYRYYNDLDAANAVVNYLQ